MYHYQAFGFTISSDLKILEFLPSMSTVSSDVQIRNSMIPTAIEENAHCLVLDIKQIARILIENGNSIRYMPYANYDEDSLRLFLLGSAMGALLQQRNHIVLHGNAVSFDGKTCTVFVGDQGVGKSTMAAWHYQQGAHILADDVCLIYFDHQGKAYVTPSYPQLKLWQASADLLQIQTQGLRKLRKQNEKFALPILDKFFSSPLPISHIIKISQDVTSAKIVHGAEKLALLTAQSYRYYFLSRMRRTAAYTKMLMQLASSVDISTQSRMVL